MPLPISQIGLVIAITEEIAKQAALRNQEDLMSVRQLNAITSAATEIVKAFATDDVLSTPESGLRAWLRSDDTGTSSLTMAAVMFDTGKYAGSPRNWCHPCDPGDFVRCHRFLEAVPEARALLPKMADVSPVWKALIEHWDELTAIYLEEKPLKKAPKLYARMQALIEPVRSL